MKYIVILKKTLLKIGLFTAVKFIVIVWRQIIGVLLPTIMYSQLIQSSTVLSSWVRACNPTSLTLIKTVKKIRAICALKRFKLCVILMTKIIKSLYISMYCLVKKNNLKKH